MQDPNSSRSLTPHQRRLRAIASLVLRLLLFLGLSAAALWFAFLYFPDAYNPFSPPDLREPPNAVTKLKLRGLEGEYAICTSLIRAAGAKARRDAITSPEPGCGMDEGLYLQQSAISWGGGVRLTCPATAALLMWEQHVVIPAAKLHLGVEVNRIRHYGTYVCRNINHAQSGRRSGHATASAIDVAGFDLTDGRRISVLDDWGKDSAEGRFLAEVHQGACGIFPSVLGPEYNALHANHFHFEMTLWGVCR